MKPMTSRNIAAVVTLLGASLLMSAPTAVQADQGKWWQPKQSRGGETRYRGGQRGADTRPYRSGQRGFDRQYRQWRGNRVYRDVYVIRSGYRGPRYRAWRSYCEPEFIYSRRIVRLRPVRYYVAASAVIGGVRISARYHDHDSYYYGCNFCDARFDTYGTYRAHVYECDGRPHGYQIVTNDWNDRELQNRDWWDDRNWVRVHTYDGDRDYGDRDYDRDYDRDRDTDRDYDRNRDTDDDRDYDRD
jgi:hypothetical protein